MAFPVDESRIRAAEEALGRTFPDVLRERLMSENGGEIDDTDEGYWFLYPVYDDSDRRRGPGGQRDRFVARRRPLLRLGSRTAGNGADRAYFRRVTLV